MGRPLQTVIAVAASNSVRRQLLHALAETDVELLAVPQNGPEALEALSRLRPELLVADAQLPGLEGASLIRKAMTLGRFPLRPAAILLHDGCFPVIGRGELEALGTILLEKPITAAQLGEAIAALRASEPVFSARDEQRAKDLLDFLGFPEHPGRDCLMRAALLCAADERLLQGMNGKLYPRLCRNLNAAQAERAMRHAIGLAWQSEQIDNQNRIFADTLDAGRGQPTCGEMISRLADILRLEG